MFVQLSSNHQKLFQHYFGRHKEWWQRCWTLTSHSEGYMKLKRSFFPIKMQSECQCNLATVSVAYFFSKAADYVIIILTAWPAWEIWSTSKFIRSTVHWTSLVSPTIFLFSSQLRAVAVICPKKINSWIFNMLLKNNATISSLNVTTSAFV